MSFRKEFDSVDLEFQYYCSLFKDSFCLLPNRNQQYIATKWNQNLTDPIFNLESLRSKRNHYLLMLIICLSSGSLKYPFDVLPPSGVLPELHSIQNPKKSKLKAKTSSRKFSQQKVCHCDFHEHGCPVDEDNISRVLDKQFEFFIHLAGSKIEKLLDLSDVRRGRQWIKFLSSIDTQCFDIKAVRNEYAMLLAGYVVNEELSGPFLVLPIEKLVPLPDLVKIVDMRNHMVIDPTHPKTIHFMKDVPLPEDGAFAFIAVTGNTYNTNCENK